MERGGKGRKEEKGRVEKKTGDERPFCEHQLQQTHYQRLSVHQFTESAP